jgi:glutamate/tyrosine decarboxylase-like PLP-dependent enzyme
MTLLRRTADRADAFLESLPDRRVSAEAGYEDVLAALDVPLPEHGESPEAVVDALAEAVETGTLAIAGPRYFGFVTGGALPAALAADWLVSAWDGFQCTRVSAPGAQAVEDVAARWVLEALGLPAAASVGFVTGATMANLVGLAAGRHRALAGAGWDVEEDGLIGAPPVRVLVGDEVHVSLLKALRILGLGSGRVERVAVDGNGAMRAEALAAALAADGRGPAIVCAQAGNVNTGACDPLGDIAEAAHERGAWVHVDGAFGLWAAAAPARAHLVAGRELCDSWATDAHKWLNVPYDCGIVAVADREAHLAAMSATAEYLSDKQAGDGVNFIPEMSRRGRQVPVYAALRSLGRAGLAELVERCCALAARAAAALDAHDGAEVLNDVVLNQVLVRFGDDDALTRAVIDGVVRSGEAWLGGTVWRGRAAARISVSNWMTTETDVDRLVAALSAALAAEAQSRHG